MTIDKIMHYAEAARKAQGIPMSTLSTACGLGKTTYYKWVNGETRPTVELLIPVLAMLGLELTLRRQKDGTA